MRATIYGDQPGTDSALLPNESEAAADGKTGMDGAERKIAAIYSKF